MENGSPPSDGKSCPVKHITHVSGGVCGCDHPAPRSPDPPRAREETQEVHHPESSVQCNRGGRRGGRSNPKRLK